MKNNKKKHITIRKEIFIISFMVLFFSSILLSGIYLKVMYNNNTKNAKSSLRACNTQIATYTQGIFRESATTIEVFSRDPMVIHEGYGDTKALLSIYDNIKNSVGSITYLYSGYTNGNLCISDYDTPENFDCTTRPWYQSAINQNEVAQTVYQDAATGDWLFSHSLRLEDENGNVTGVIAADSSNESLTQMLSTKYQFDSQRSFIVDENGTVLIHPTESIVNDNIRNYLSDNDWNFIINGKSNYCEYVLNNIKTLANFERVHNTNYIIVTAINASELSRPIIINLINLSAIAVILSILIAILLSQIMVIRFAFPIVELSHRLQELAAGKSPTPQKTRFSNEEVNDIADSIQILVLDIAKREEQRKTAEFFSYHDSMTGVYNRRFFEEELQRLDISENFPISIICCDINGLKLTNDVFGHATGDKLIEVIALCMRGVCRTNDILARTGGDEFSILLPRTTAKTAELFINQIKESFPKGSINGAKVSASFGYAVKENILQTMKNVLEAADNMMYERKILESNQMKKDTLRNIIKISEKEGIIAPLTNLEQFLLTSFSKSLCPDLSDLLHESYRLRHIGMCSLVLGSILGEVGNRHSEASYRILSSIEEYRIFAGYVLHYMEHWDGSGRPAGLSGTDIPLLSRIIAITHARASGMSISVIKQKSGKWYDPSLVKLLTQIEEST